MPGRIENKLVSPVRVCDLFTRRSITVPPIEIPEILTTQGMQRSFGKYFSQEEIFNFSLLPRKSFGETFHTGKMRVCTINLNVIGRIYFNFIFRSTFHPIRLTSQQFHHHKGLKTREHNKVTSRKGKQTKNIKMPYWVTVHRRR